MKKTAVLLILILFAYLLYAAEALPKGNAEIKLAIIDSGIASSATHAEQVSRGKNYMNPKGDTEDKIGHGTAIAGIIVGSEAAGITGVCENATLVPLVTVEQDEKGNITTAEPSVLAQAVRDAIDKFGCRVINISAGTTKDDPDLREAIIYAEERGAVVVAAVGNTEWNAHGKVYYPAAYDTVIGVGSLNSDGTVSSFSQQGDFVDICAPGDSLRVLSIRGKKISAFGTSYSAAYVSGAVAKLLLAQPELTPARARELLYSTAIDIAPEGYDTASGWGALQ